jgi:four helix bundle protein
LNYQLLLARDLGFLARDRFEELALEIDEISRMLIGLMKHLKKVKRRPEAGRAA